MRLLPCNPERSEDTLRMRLVIWMAQEQCNLFDETNVWMSAKSPTRECCVPEEESRGTNTALDANSRFFLLK